MVISESSVSLQVNGDWGMCMVSMVTRKGDQIIEYMFHRNCVIYLLTPNLSIYVLWNSSLRRQLNPLKWPCEQIRELVCRTTGSFIRFGLVV